MPPHRMPGTVMLEHALDGLGASPHGMAYALGAWIVRQFGPVKAGQFADTVVKAVQIEIRKEQREAPFVEVQDEPETISAIAADLDTSTGIVAPLAAGLAGGTLALLIFGMGWVSVDVTTRAVELQIAAGAAEW